MPLNTAQFACSVFCRFLQGLAAVAVILAPLQTAENFTLATVTARLCVAAMLCGSGLTAVLEQALKPLLGVQSGCVLTALCTATGVGLLWVEASPLVAALLVGIGIGSQWSTVSEVARRSLPTKLRWRGIGFWTISFSLGAAIAIAVGSHGDVQIVFWISAILAAIVLILLLLANPLQVERTAALEPAVPDMPTAQSAVSSVAEVADADVADESEECDATECCGGGVRDILPTAFWHGVFLASVGMLSFYLTVCHLCVMRFHLSDWSLVTFAIGLPAGYLLMINTAPRIGYIIALLPCLFLGAVSAATFQLSSLNGVWASLLTFFCGVFSAAVFCGINSVVGELFSDCPTDAKRSRVLSVALFASSALMVVLAAVRAIADSDTVMAMAWPAVFVGGLLAIRSLPSPVISSLGSDDDSNSDDAELNDVLSALND